MVHNLKNTQVDNKQKVGWGTTTQKVESKPNAMAWVSGHCKHIRLEPLLILNDVIRKLGLSKLR